MGAVTDVTVVIPYTPRPLQRVLHDALESHRWCVAVCHRRFGKTVLAINHLQKQALLSTKERPRFAYVAPTYKQGKAIAWDYMKHYAAPIPSVTVNESELRIDYPNGAQVRIYGADNPDSLRGIYLDGAVLDEYGLQPPTIFDEVIRPLLTDRRGWALFIGTPNGKNQFYDVAHRARTTEGWYFAEYKASDTGVIPVDELEAARSQMTEDSYLQEFECSFEASVKGAIYAREMMQARRDGRVAVVPYDPQMLVDTDWDLGVGDATSIWFSQSSPSGQVRLIDYYESSGEGLQHYASVLKSKPYAYGSHWAPHDIEVRELGSGLSRKQIAQGLGLYFQTVERRSLADGIAAARVLLPKCWFDETRCHHGIESLQHYRWDYNQRIDEFKPVPVHDWASHCADAFRGLAVRHFTPKMAKRENDRLRDTDSGDARRRRSDQIGGRGGW